MSIVDMADIFCFMGTDFVRPFTAGSALVRAGHVFDIRLKQNKATTELFGLCLSMSAMAGPPHRIHVKITDTVSSEMYSYL